MLEGRDAETDRLRAALRTAGQGGAEVLQVLGPPGTGKTALLAEARRCATGFHVVALVGVPSEQALAHAGIATLVHALRATVATLPPEVRDVLTAPGRHGDLALGTALLALLGAGEAPVLLLLDDVPWLDDDSWRPLAFALRRLAAERVVALVAARDDVPPPLPETPTLRLGGLDGPAAGRLLRTGHPDLAPGVVTDLTAATGGNPLALQECGRALTPRQRQGLDALPAVVPVPERLRAGFAARLAALPPPAAAALLLLAVTGQAPDDDSLLAAERAGLVVLSGGQADFPHPLVRSAVLAAAAPADLRAAHREAARGWAAAGDADRALLHRCAAATGPDEALAEQLAAAAEHAGAAPVTAGRRWQQAATLTRHAPLRARWLVSAAETALSAADLDRADLLADDVDAGLLPAGTTGRPAFVRGRVAALRGRSAPAAALLLAAADDLPAQLAGPALAAGVEAALDAGDPALASRAVARAAALAGDAPDPVLALLLGRVEAVQARDTGELARLTRLLRPHLGAVDPGQLGTDATAWTVYATALLETDDLEGGRDAYLTAAGLARARHDRTGLAEALSSATFVDHALGRWNSAYASGAAALDLVDGRGAPALVAEVQHVLADIDAARGRDASCRHRCDLLRALAHDLDRPWYALLAARRLAALELARNRLEEAVDLLLHARALLDEGAAPRHPLYSPVPDLVEALVRLGRPAGARDLLPEFAALVPADGPAPAVARLLRSEALLADPDEHPALFERSIALDEGTRVRFLQARTRLCYGERLRRDRRRVAARVPLLAALEAFDRLDAAPWAERTRAELAASGAPVRRSPQGSAAELTPQELQIALAVADGRRNKDVAGALFLSVRTVEFHLSRVYTKLGVTSRAELAGRLVR